MFVSLTPRTIVLLTPDQSNQSLIISWDLAGWLAGWLVLYVNIPTLTTVDHGNDISSGACRRDIVDIMFFISNTHICISF